MNKLAKYIINYIIFINIFFINNIIEYINNIIENIENINNIINIIYNEILAVKMSIKNKNFITRCISFEKLYKNIPKPMEEDYEGVFSYHMELELKINSNKYYRFALSGGCSATLISKKKEKSKLLVQKHFGDKIINMYIYKYNARIPYKYEKLTKLPKTTLYPIYVSLLKIFPTDIIPNITKYYSTINYFRNMLYEKLKSVNRPIIEFYNGHTKIIFENRPLVSPKKIRRKFYYSIIKINHKTGETKIGHCYSPGEEEFTPNTY